MHAQFLLSLLLLPLATFASPIPAQNAAYNALTLASASSEVETASASTILDSELGSPASVPALELRDLVSRSKWGSGSSAAAEGASKAKAPPAPKPKKGEQPKVSDPHGVYYSTPPGLKDNWRKGGFYKPASDPHHSIHDFQP